LWCINHKEHEGSTRETTEIEAANVQTGSLTFWFTRKKLMIDDFIQWKIKNQKLFSYFCGFIKNVRKWKQHC